MLRNDNGLRALRNAKCAISFRAKNRAREKAHEQGEGARRLSRARRADAGLLHCTMHLSAAFERISHLFSGGADARAEFESFPEMTGQGEMA
jgi:hypothetical protein